MAAAPPNTAAETKQKVEQIIRESIVKVVQIVVGARCTLPSSGRTNKWFNTATEEVESLTEELAQWRKNIFAPLLLNVYLDLDSIGENASGRGGLLLERWKLLFDQSSPALPSSVEVPTLYKKTVVLIRSLFTYLRLMPARRLVREAQQHKLPRAIKYALSRQELNPPFPSGIACSECRFAALDTPYGRFSVHVIFRQDCNFKILITPQLHDDTLITSKFIIQDYMPDAKPPRSSPPTPIPGSQPISAPTTPLSPPNSYQTGPTVGTSPAGYTYLGSSSKLQSSSAPVLSSATFLTHAPLGGGVYYSPPSSGTTPPSASRLSRDSHDSKSPPDAVSKASPGTSPHDARQRMSPRSTMLIEPHSSSFLTDPAFASGGSADADSEAIMEAELDRLTQGVDKLRF